MPTPTYRGLVAAFRFLVSAFFREIEVTGREHVPSDRGGVVVSWHPNGLIDPGLILTQFPRPVVFGARHGLFAWPVLGSILRAIGTVPIYRASDNAKADPEARRLANKKSLEALAEAVARGSFSALFPEGQSHDQPYLMELKTGAARLVYRAAELSPMDSPDPVIIPVGLFYARKKAFRSRALVWFHPPIAIPPELAPAALRGKGEAEISAAAKGLTELMERELSEVVLATDDWSTHFLLHRSRKLVRAERALRAGAAPGRPDMVEKALGFARVRAGYIARMATHPEETLKVRAAVEAYDDDLRAMKLDDHDLDRDPDVLSPWLLAMLLLQIVFVFLLLPPVLIFGYAANGPTALALWVLSQVAAKKKKDVATIKLLLGAVAFPVTWLAAAILGAFLHGPLHTTFPTIPDHPWIMAGAVGVLAAFGGIAALRYLHVSQTTLRAVRTRLTRRRRNDAIARLKAERARLFEEIMRMSEGLALPGEVSADGSVRADR
ncbi:MAG: 1-acyl-sn-glycerol-3-phosphate acyltransferase [Deltaproteobacteria bacterium]|nr:1-acyl-sn-glycerol-3-phosphate acyltransferase [Deltaproteobacteria bacterium]